MLPYNTDNLIQSDDHLLFAKKCTFPKETKNNNIDNKNDDNISVQRYTRTFDRTKEDEDSEDEFGMGLVTKQNSRWNDSTNSWNNIMLHDRLGYDG